MNRYNDTTPEPLTTLLWVAVAAVFAAAAVLLPGLPAIATVAVLGVAAAALWSIRRPELLLVGLLGAASLDAVGRLAQIGPLIITAYQGVLFGLLLLFALLAFTGGERVRASGLEFWIALLLGSALVTIPRAVNHKAALVAFVSLASSVVVVYVVVSIAERPERLRFVLSAFALITAGLAVFAIAERYEIFAFQAYYRTFADGVRPKVFFGDPNMLGGVLAAGAVMAIPLALVSRSRLQSVVMWGAALVSAAGMVVTLSRGAWLGFVVGAIVAIAVTPVRGWIRIGLLAAGAAGVMLIAVFALDPEWIADKVTGIANNPSALNRIYLAQAALNMAAANPLGVGPGMWKETILAFRTYSLPATLLESHTTYFTVLVELGVVGLAGIIGVLVATVVKGARALAAPGSAATKALLASSLGGFAVFALQSLTYSMETSKFFWFTIGATLAAAAIVREKGSAA